MIKIENIRQSFINEAKVAPTLFADLAKVELYIAESYRARAFIELLQNADDAGAKDFIIQLYEDKLIVANNGRTFTSDDIQALCRSGSSNKQRGTGTIGYRGIGFKSVAGIATEIDVISGEYHFRFSKSLTKTELSSNQDTPLIRIPHPLAKTDTSVAIAKKLIDQEAISTVFIMSGLDLRILSSEAEAFEESTLLFLNNIRQVKIDLSGISKLFKRSAILRDDGYTVESIGDNGKDNSWLIVGIVDGCEKIAFRIRDEVIIPTEREQAVIHAFMPTTEFAGALLKINGDFSTDPSRKSIDMDNLSATTFKRCSHLLADLIRRALKDKSLHGIFSTFTMTSPIEGRFRKYLREALLADFELTGLSLAGLKSVKPVDICLPPEWLNYADYEILCRDLPHVPHLIMTIHPDVIAFFKWLVARQLNIEDALKFSKERNLSVLGCAQLLCRFAHQYRFTMTEDQLSLLKSCPILPLQNSMIPISQYTAGDLDIVALTFLKQAADIEDIRFLFRRLGIESILGLDAAKNSATPKLTPSPSTSSQGGSPKSPASPTAAITTPAIKQWRSAEQNALAWFSALENVLTAKDVSKANVGYDLEIMLKNGKCYYVEVKSVKRLGDAIRITNNEHSTAHLHGKSYLFVIVVNSDPLEIKIIQDPINTLTLEKRCEQWVWCSENYANEAIDIGDFTQEGEI